MGEKKKTGGDGGGGAPAPPMPGWKKLLLSVALLCALLGLGLELFGPEPAPDGAAGASPAGSTSLTGRPPAASRSASAEPSVASRAAPYLTRGGFSFILAFCVGLVLRKSLKVGAILVGVVVIGAVGLHLGGVIDLDWIAIRDSTVQLATKVEHQTRGALDFFKNSLSTTAAAVVGLGVGFWRA